MPIRRDKRVREQRLYPQLLCSKKENYRAIFVVPFSNSRALERFIESISQETEREDAKITLYWRGGRVRMNMMNEELGRLNCFGIHNVVYKDGQIKGDSAEEES